MLITKSNCELNHYTEDKCLKCHKSYRLYQDDCVEVDANCIDFEIVDDEVICNKCVDEYFPNEDKCVLGDIHNCWKYDQNTDDCLKYYNSFNIEILH